MTLQDPNRAGADGDPIIFELIDARDLNAIIALVEQGADVNARGFADQTPAIKAALVECWDICRFLLQRGADPTLVSEQGMTLRRALDMAITRRDSPQGAHLDAIDLHLRQLGL